MTQTSTHYESHFIQFADSIAQQSGLRAAITAAYRRKEADCIRDLLSSELQPDAAQAEQICALAQQLVLALRSKKSGGVEGLIQQFSLSSQEGVALMCLAEALLRIPDAATRDNLIRDKLSGGDWSNYLGQSESLFVNAVSWGLMLTGKLVSVHDEKSLGAALTRLVAQGGEPLIRKAMDMAMRMMGEQFVCGETIADALRHSRKFEPKGFRYSYDMLGEAAMTEDDAQRYYAAYEMAIHAIGKAANGRGIYEGPGISIKLSALHPRYSRAKHERVMRELLPRLLSLARLARDYDIGLNIDAEEADRLEISLDLLEAMCFDAELKGWNGIGFVVQAYQKRAPLVLDYLIDLARRSQHRLMIRLVKGAYWDSEIKRAQLDGLDDYPVYTRKIYTDVAYQVCAGKLLAAPVEIYPQFATHNAQTLASIYHMAGGEAAYYPGQYEFQCLHGMGEPLYEEAVSKLSRPCRIYAPVGSHKTLLAYLVRRLLENGANSSFVNRIADEQVPVTELSADPFTQARAITPLYSPHAQIGLPGQLFGDDRSNSRGLDLSNEQQLARLASALQESAGMAWRSAAMLADRPIVDIEAALTLAQQVLNPADHSDIVGYVLEANTDDVLQAYTHAVQSGWPSAAIAVRAACLNRAADLLEARMPVLLGLLVREAGKSLPNSIAEVREAVDFLRYYAAQIGKDFRVETHQGLGPVVCISPWNFPLAIFVGQLAAALAAGNPVLAKPAEQTPLIAAEAVRILHQAGIPADALQLLPGQGETVGAALIADSRCKGVMFTGSTEVARILAKVFAQRLDEEGRAIPLIAETGGQNCMIVDSSALAEQVVGDVIMSAFDSAGQRCSALRVLCLQSEIADHVLDMLKGAMLQLQIGNPAVLASDVGPVIDRDAQAQILQHIMQLNPAQTFSLPLPEACRNGTFVAPTLIEIGHLSELKREVFGPVLHVIRYQREQLDDMLAQIRATGYGLTFGLHSRIDETIAHVLSRVHVGNIYVNRNVIGAVVGVQPFGGEGLSGTGPKAGGPLYLQRLLARRIEAPVLASASTLADLAAFREAILPVYGGAAQRCARYLAQLKQADYLDLPGPTGEQNRYFMLPRGMVLCLCESLTGALAQWTAVLSSGNQAIFADVPAVRELLKLIPASLLPRIRVLDRQQAQEQPFDAVLFEGDAAGLLALNQTLASRDGAIIQAQGWSSQMLEQGRDYELSRLIAERSVSINTAAAGGNASLMALG
ncbi:trifunctional transcriptional regulator/proline dehydrogenase/L-glutamate gamma-semialdehyde dehydrogenase [Chitinibacter sp. GC72]|uniref:trifunctional transcriptional regulator/proline dehydrogenase/L-glutamate gamma-semialdehyde dehydrogenase n=1 Tax=Chitinibacter sp. GC72 TaxID=1526917 RepID=UPI0012FB486C|nr:trifunctional transcriptional regulator/proline dehydrogenase/L-glutamate gamma-semialdehyde dehydrogenase [Chitinibacter sp. GC72]